MSANTLPLPPGAIFRPSRFDTNSSLRKAFNTDLGRIYTENGKRYVLCKAAGALSAPGGKLVVTALDTTSKLPTWVVDTTTTANNHLAVGIIPRTLTEALAAGDIFLVQLSGPAEVISAGAITAGGLIGSSTSAGKVDDATVTAGVGAVGVALEAAAGADEIVAVLLKGLW